PCVSKKCNSEAESSYKIQARKRSLVTKQYTCYAPKIKECDGIPAVGIAPLNSLMYSSVYGNI
ncbi:MAG: hypothetical protein ACYTX0_34495, partial [Nostoc sp.]